MSYNLLAPSVTKPEEFHMSDIPHLETNFRKDLLLNRISREKPDILCVQECDWKKVGKYINALGFIEYKDQFFTKGSTFGQAIFVRGDKFKILTHHHQKFTENMQTFLMLQVESLQTGCKYSIINTHLKARKTFLAIRISQMAELATYIDTLDPTNVIIVCGDMNDEPLIVKKHLLDITPNLQYAIEPKGFTLSIQEDYRLELLWVDYILIRTSKEFIVSTNTVVRDHKSDNIMPSNIESSDHVAQVVELKFL